MKQGLTKRLYVVVRADIPAGLQLAQACHVTREFTLAHPEEDVGENLVVLHAPNEPELARLVHTVDPLCLSSIFYEPDLGGAMTAVAFSGDARRHLSSLPLALRPRASDVDGAPL